jgi:hypothetical protein
MQTEGFVEMRASRTAGLEGGRAALLGCATARMSSPSPLAGGGQAGGGGGQGGDKVMYGSIRGTLRMIWREEGMRGLFKVTRVLGWVGQARYVGVCGVKVAGVNVECLNPNETRSPKPETLKRMGPKP